MLDLLEDLNLPPEGLCQHGLEQNFLLVNDLDCVPLAGFLVNPELHH